MIAFLANKSSNFLHFNKKNNEFIKVPHVLTYHYALNYRIAWILSILAHEIYKQANYRQLSSKDFQNYPLTINYWKLAKFAWPNVEKRTAIKRVKKLLQQLVVSDFLVMAGKKKYFLTSKSADCFFSGSFFKAPMNFMEFLGKFVSEFAISDADNVISEEEASHKAGLFLYCGRIDFLFLLLNKFSKRFKQDKEEWWSLDLSITEEIKEQHAYFDKDKDLEETKDKIRMRLSRQLLQLKKAGLIILKKIHNKKGHYQITLCKNLIELIKFICKAAKTKYQAAIAVARKTVVQQKVFGKAEQPSSIAEGHFNSPFRTSG